MMETERKLQWAVTLCVVFFVMELFAGIWSGSLAILADAFHLLSDIAGFLISLLALYLGNKTATERLSYGYKRIEILGAVLSTLIIWGVTLLLLWEAVDRLRFPHTIDAKVMLVTAVFGVAINIMLAMTLHADHGHGHGHGHGHEHGHGHGHSHSHSHEPCHSTSQDSEDHPMVPLGTDEENELNGEGSLHEADSHLNLRISGQNATSEKAEGPFWFASIYNLIHSVKHMNINVQSAAIHVIGDLISSIGVLISSIIILIFPSLTIVDALCTFLFSILVVMTTLSLMKSSITVLMEGVPIGIEPGRILKELRAIPGVREVHDVHVWSLSQGQHVATAHLVLDFGNDEAKDFELESHNNHTLRQQTQEECSEVLTVEIDGVSKEAPIILEELHHEHHDKHHQHHHHHHQHDHHHHHNDTVDHSEDDHHNLSDATHSRVPTEQTAFADTVHSSDLSQTLTSVAKLSHHNQILQQAQEILCHKFGIHHTTIQVEDSHWSKRGRQLEHTHCMTFA